MEGRHIVTFVFMLLVRSSLSQETQGDCTPGQYYHPELNRCRDCDIGSFQPNGAAANCFLCAPGSSTVSAKSTSPDDCYQPCDPGYYLNLNSNPVGCEICPRGYFNPSGQYPNGGVRVSCDQCPGGRTTENNGATDSDVCIDDQSPVCQPGFYFGGANKDCFKCPRGFYQPEANQGSCFQCPDQRTTVAAGSTSVGDCIDGSQGCGVGNFFVGGTCQLCPQGTYNDKVDSNCVTCPDGRTTAALGADSLNDCVDLPDNCAAGYFLDSLGSVCEACPKGFYQPEAGQSTCLQCDQDYTTREVASTGGGDCVPVQQGGCIPGKFWDGAECLLCAVGYYNPLPNQLSCQLCPNSWITTGTGTVSAAGCFAAPVSDCDPGYFYEVGVCRACPRNFYQALRGQETCVACGDGKVTQAVGSLSILACIDEFVCPGGSYTPPGDSCQFCPPDTYQPLAGQVACVNCDDGYSAPVGSTSPSACTAIPVDCLPGYFVESGGGCSLCPRNTYQALRGQADCVPCPGAQITDSIGSTSVTACHATIETCQPGYVRDPQGFCTLCPVGSYQPQADQTNCIDCDFGYSTFAPGAVQESDCIPRCAAGNYEVNGVCSPCPMGTYQPNDNSQECFKCPDSRSTRVTGARSIGACVTTCIPGYYITSEGTCEKCKIGEYQPQNDQPYCFRCPIGFTTMFVGSPHVTACVGICTEGQYFEVPEGCKPCPRDFYQPEPRKDKCIACPAGYKTEAEGSVDESQCLAICTPGSYIAENGACVPCRRGSYQPLASQTGCLVCPDGLTTRVVGALQINACVVICQPGTYTTGAGCTQCDLGHYQPDPDKQSCLICPTGTTTRVTGTPRESMCVPICGPGNFLSGGSCLPCPRGTWNALTEQTTCNPCDADYTSVIGATSPNDCQLVCEIGNYRVNGNCAQCPIGFYQDTPGMVECIPCIDGYTTLATGAAQAADCLEICLPGHFFTNGQCAECGLGHYQPESGRIECIPCGDGKSTTGVASTSITDCVDICRPGTYLVDTSCVMCDMGYYQPFASALNCIKCPGARTTLEPGSTNIDQCITVCDAGHYAVPGTDDCLACRVGTYSPVAGAVSNCIPCLDGYTTDGIGASSPDMCHPICNTGYTLSDEMTCAACDLGYYKPVIGGDPCISCAPGHTTRFIAATRPSDCFAVCQPGHYNAGGGCVPCAKGYYQSLPGQPSCVACNPGTTTFSTGSADASACQLFCSVGYQKSPSGMECEPCARGYFRGTQGGDTCVPCPAGTSTLVIGATNIDMCNIGDCGPGSYISGQGCEPCDVAYYQPESHMFSCKRCPLRFTTADIGASRESDCFFTCPMGQYAPAGNECLLCPKGTYKDSMGASAICIVCEAGYTTAGVGATSGNDCNIRTCTAGYYRNTATNQCIMCPKGQFQDQENQVACKLCTAGFTTYGNFANKDSSACLSTNECQVNQYQCPPFSECVDLPGVGYSCDCATGYLKTGDTCVHECDAGVYCQNGGMCLKTMGGPMCQCTVEYTGAHCETKLGTMDTAMLIGIIVGSILGLLLLILLSVCLWYCCCRREEKVVVEQPPPQPQPIIIQEVKREKEKPKTVIIRSPSPPPRPPPQVYVETVKLPTEYVRESTPDYESSAPKVTTVYHPATGGSHIGSGAVYRPAIMPGPSIMTSGPAMHIGSSALYNTTGPAMNIGSTAMYGAAVPAMPPITSAGGPVYVSGSVAHHPHNVMPPMQVRPGYRTSGAVFSTD